MPAYYKGKRIAPVKVIELGGEYNIDQIIDGDECELVITLADGSEITLDLPEEFGNAGNVYYFQVDEDTLLVSGDANDIGVWMYTLSTNIWEQKYSHSEWDVFQMVGNNCLLGRTLSGYNDGILLYDSETKTINRIYTSGTTWRNFHVVENDCIISGYGSTVGILLYDGKTKTIEQKYDISYWDIFQDVPNGCLISTTNSSGSIHKGVLLYNKINKTITQIYQNGINHATFKKVNNGNYLITCQTYDAGLLLYNSVTNDIKKVYGEPLQTTANWREFQLVPNGCLIGSSSSSDTGILFYDDETEEVTLKYEIGQYWRDFIVVNNNCLILGGKIYSSYGDGGILVYNTSTKTIQQIYTETFSYTTNGIWWYVINNDCILTSTSKGILYYDGSLNTITKYFESYSSINKFEKVGNKILMGTGSSSLKGILEYDIDTKVIEHNYTSGGYWCYFSVLKDGNCLISSSNTNSKGILLYDIETNSILKLSKVGYNYTTCKYINGVYLLSSMNKSVNPLVLEYNPATKTTKLAKYYIGKV